MNDEEMNTKQKRTTLVSNLGLYLKRKFRRKIRFFFFFEERGDEVNQLLISEWIRLPRECIWAENRVQGTITKNIYIRSIGEGKEVKKKLTECVITEAKIRRSFKKGDEQNIEIFIFFFI